MKKLTKNAKLKLRDPQPEVVEEKTPEQLTQEINQSISKRVTTGEHLRQIDELSAAYKAVEVGKHPEVVIHALAQRCVLLYQQLAPDDHRYDLILLNSLSNALSLCINMYHNDVFYGNLTGEEGQ